MQINKVSSSEHVIILVDYVGFKVFKEKIALQSIAVVLVFFVIR